MKYFLSIDYGGTNTKAIIFDEEGNQVGVSSFATLKIEETPGFREVDLEQTWQAIASSVRKVIASSKVSPKAIAAVACVGHGKGLYLLDKEGKPFERGILSTDERAVELAKKFEKRLPELWSLTHQHIIGVQNPVLLNWIKMNDSTLYSTIGSILSAKDFIRYKLTGVINQEYSDASSNHWINFQTGNYDSKILDFFEIPEMLEALPPLVSYKDIVGGVSDEAAKLTGLNQGTPVVGGLFDIDACAIGSGVVNDSSISVISGTWNINTFPSRELAPQDSGVMNSYFPTGKFLVEASSPTSAGNLDAILKMLMAEEINNLKAQGRSIYEMLEEFLGETSASYTPLIFFPFLYGSNTSEDAKASFLGLTTSSTKSHLIRAVYEGIAFAHKRHLEQLLKVKPSKTELIRLSGGATNSREWVKIFADILEMPIETVVATELGGLGGAIAAAQAVYGYSLDEAVQKMVKVKECIKPRSSESDSYRQKYDVYQRLLKSLDEVWPMLDSLYRLNEQE